MEATVKYPDIKVRLSGTDGNVFALISKCTSAAKRANLSSDVIKQFTTEVMSVHSYDEAIQVMMSWFDVS